MLSIGLDFYNMKKILVFTIFCFYGVLFAQKTNSLSSFSTVQNLLKDGLEENFVEIIESSGNLSDMQRNALYKEFKKQDV